MCLNSPTPTAVLLPAVPLGVDEQLVASVVDGCVCVYPCSQTHLSQKKRFCLPGDIVLPVLFTAPVTCDHGRDQAQLCQTVPTASRQTLDLAEALSNEQRAATRSTSDIIQVSKYVFYAME